MWDHSQGCTVRGASLGGVCCQGSTVRVATAGANVMCLYINYCHKSKFLLADCALQHVMIVKTVMP